MALEIMIGVLLIALCTMAGRAAAMKSVVEADEIRRLQEDVLCLKMLTLEKRLPQAEALSKLKSSVFRKMSHDMKNDPALSLKEAWAIAAGKENMKAEIADLFGWLFGAAENLSRDQQEAEYARLGNDLKRIEEDKRKAGMEKVKLYMSLGAVTGVCAVIFCV